MSGRESFFLVLRPNPLGGYRVYLKRSREEWVRDRMMDTAGILSQEGIAKTRQAVEEELESYYSFEVPADPAMLKQLFGASGLTEVTDMQIRYLAIFIQNAVSGMSECGLLM